MQGAKMAVARKEQRKQSLQQQDPATWGLHWGARSVGGSEQ